MKTTTIALALSLIALAFATASPASALGTTYTIGNGEVITSSITGYDDIVLPAGRTAYYAAEIVLSATNSITISGSLRDYAPDTQVRSISLISGKDITIAGNIRAREGLSAANVTANASATGGDGGWGGNISLQWGLLGTFSLASGSYIRAGNGGGGGSVFIVVDNGTAGDVNARGGNGGGGGNISLSGLSYNIQGSLYVGNGGSGGTAAITQDVNATDTLAENWTAVGGTGGAAPSMQRPAIGFCDCGSGGGGGAAIVDRLPGIVSPTCNGDTVSKGGDGGRGGPQGGRGGDAKATGCTGHPGVAGGIGQSGRNGQNGGAGRATAGNGGWGSATGGDGGDATGVGGSGGAGGPGGLGGAGGNGGNGGDGEAHGGDGGSSLCQAGQGGSATSVAGNGGSGGQGGAGAGNGSNGSNGSNINDPGHDGDGNPFCGS